jgi:hypothetical protein
MPILLLCGMDKPDTKAGWSKAIENFLAGENSVDEVKEVLRKCLKVMSYTNFTQNAYIQKTITEKLQSGKKLVYREEEGEEREEIAFEKTNTTDVTDQVENILKDPENYMVGEEEVQKDIIAPTSKRKLREVSTEMKVSKEEILKYNPKITEIKNECNTKRETTQDMLKK